MTVIDDLFRSALVVCAHPDDESFGLGAILASLTERRVRVDLLCFTHGEASTLGSPGSDLGRLRAAELAQAVSTLGINAVTLLSYPDGELSTVATDRLADEINAALRLSPAEFLIAMDEGGITGHPDHQAATAAARQAAMRQGLDLLAWAIPEPVADALNAEFDAGFVGRRPEEIDLILDVDRSCQHEAIVCHASQSSDNPVLTRRLQLLGNTESLRWLHRSHSIPHSGVAPLG